MAAPTLPPIEAHHPVEPGPKSADAREAPSAATVRRTRSAAVLDLLLLALLAAFCAALLRATLLRGGAMLGFDLFNYFFPGKVYAAEALRRGELPLWNPDVFFGVPFLANVQMGVLYLPNLLFVLWEFPRAVALSQWLHLTLAAAGMYLLCRRVWCLAPVPAAVGALAFTGGGFFAAHMGHLNQVHAAAWLPWLALCHFKLAAALGASRWRADGGRRLGPSSIRLLPAAGIGWFLLGSVVVALQLTAGHTQEAYYSLFALGLLAAGFTLLPPAWAPWRWPHLPALGVIVVNGALLSAAQLIPTFELSGHSYRQGGVPLEEAVSFGVERTYLLESLLPTYWSLPSQEVTGYVGVVALVLALAGLASPARRTVVALAALALLAIVLTLGAYTPVYPLLHEWVPMFGSFRAPGRWLLVSSFALAGLAAHGLDALRFRRSPALREGTAFRLALGAAALAGLGVLFTWRSAEVHAIHWLPHARVAVLWLAAAVGALALSTASVFSRVPWPSVALLGALALELGFAAREMEYNRPGDPSLYRDPPAVASAVSPALARPSDPPERTLSLAAEERLDAERLRRAVPGGDGEHRRYAAMREVLRPNLGMVYGLHTIDGYDGGLLPLRDYALFKSLLVMSETPVPHFTLAGQAPPRPDSRLLGALNVRYLLTDGRAGPPGDGWNWTEAPLAPFLYENAAVQSRAFLVGEIEAEPDPRRAIVLVRTSDLRRVAVLERPLSVPLGGASSIAGASATFRRYSATEVEIETSSPSPALLVLTETYYPGWTATVDGAPASPVRANLLFRAVPVPAGTHRVLFRYDPLSIKLGFAVSALALLANVAVLVRLLLRRNR